MPLDLKNVGFLGSLTGEEIAWNILKIIFNDEISVTSPDTLPAGVFFRPTGLVMYTGGGSAGNVSQWDLSGAWDITSAILDATEALTDVSTTVSVTLRESNGTKMYVLSTSPRDFIAEYDLSGAWDVETATLNDVHATFMGGDTPRGLWWKSDGTKLYILSGDNEEVISQWDVGTAWDISTLTWVAQLRIDDRDSQPWGLVFKPDGTKMFFAGDISEEVHEYALSVAYDITTATWTKALDISSLAGVPKGLRFNDDGTEMFFIGNSVELKQIHLDTAYDMGGFTGSESFSLINESFAPQGFDFNSDGTKMYITDTFLTSRTIYEYDLTTAYDLSDTVTFVDSKNVLPFTSSLSDFFMRPNGDECWITNPDDDGIHNFTLSTTDDITSASDAGNAGVHRGTSDPDGMFIRQDGLKLYVVSNEGLDRIYEYDLDVAWDITTLNLVQEKSINTDANTPTGIYFKPDGTRCYFTSNIATDKISEWSLSVAWDISTMTFINKIDINAKETSPTGLFIRSDGFKLYTVGTQNDQVDEYDFVA